MKTSAHAFKRDIDNIEWFLAIGNTNVNLGFETSFKIYWKKHPPLNRSQAE